MAADLRSEVVAFIQAFRDEHREARDILLGMMDAFRAKDASRFAELMDQMDRDLGVHMRYEEEVMYAALEEFYGPEYLEGMLQDHDRMLGVAGRLGELAAQDPITDEDVEEAIVLLRGQLPHVSDCDGLGIIIEALPPDKQLAIVDARERAKEQGLTVMEWAERRGRTPIFPG